MFRASLVTQALRTTRPEDAPSGVRFTAAAAMEAKDKLIVNFILSFTGARPPQRSYAESCQGASSDCRHDEAVWHSSRMRGLFSLANGEQ